MSLPAAPKDVSEKPKKGAVTSPHDKAKLEADVDRKLHMYGVVEAFRKGRMPDNAQIDAAFKYAYDNSPVDEARLSPQGKTLIKDARDIIDTLRLIVKEKNGDELLQRFYWGTRAIELTPSEAEKEAKEGKVTVDQAKEDSRLAQQHIRTLVSLILTNSEVRKLVKDFGVIGQDLLSRTLAEGARMVAPDEDKLRQADEAGDASAFHEKEKADIEANGAAAATGNGTTSKPAATGTTEPPAAAVETPLPGATSAEVTAAEEAKTSGISDTETPSKKDKKTLKQRFTSLRSRVPQEHRDTANEHYGRARRFLSEDYFPKERRDRFIWRGKKVILECQRHDDYQESMSWLLGLFERYGKHGREYAADGKVTATEVVGSESVGRSIEDLRTLLERFANGYTMEPILEAIRVLYEDAQKDEGLREWWKRVDTWVRQTLLEPGYVLDDACASQGTSIREDGRKFYDEKYKAHFDRLFDETKAWFAQMAKDPLNDRFGKDWARLTKDLLFDAEGSLAFKPELWKDIRTVILPGLVDKVGYVPIPRAEYSDDNIDLVLENLTLQGKNLFPNIIALEAHNYFKFSPYNTIGDEQHHSFKLTLAHIQADMRDVHFSFKRKTGVPRLSDRGVADVLLGGEGISAVVHLQNAKSGDTAHVFRVKDVSVKVGDLKFAVRGAKHGTLYKLVGPLAKGAIKKQIKNAVAEAIRTGLEYVDEELVKVRARMSEAKASEDKEETRAKVLREMFKRKQDEVGSIASSVNKRSSFKIATKRESVLLPEYGHKDGWVNRTSDKSKVAAEGDEWRSNAFTLKSQDRAAAAPTAAQAGTADQPAAPATTATA